LEILRVPLTQSDYSNVLYTSYMPILSSVVFDNKGEIYNVTKVLNKDFVFDQVAYENYSRVFLPTTYILSYALQFAAVPALIVHTVCWHGRDTYGQFKESWREAKQTMFPKKERVLSRTASNISASGSTFSSRSHATSLNNMLSEEDMAASTVCGKYDVPVLWYLLTGLGMTAVGIFVVEKLVLYKIDQYHADDLQL